MTKLKFLISAVCVTIVIAIISSFSSTYANTKIQKPVQGINETDLLDYNLLTGEVTKVDMNLIDSKENSLSYENTHRIEPYIPEGMNNSDIMPFGDISPTSTNSAICLVEVQWGSTGGEPDVRYSTAFMVGPNLALTCAHSIFSEERKNKELPAYISVYAGRDNLDSKEVTSVTNVQVQGGWYNNYMEDYDWSLLILKDNIGYKTGTLGIAYSDDYSYFQTKKETVSLIRISYTRCK